MVRREIELTPLIEMALEAGLRRFARIDDGIGRAARLDVQAAGAVTRFASDILRVVAGRLQPVMGRGDEAFCNVLMACLARIGADKSGPGNLRRRDILRLAHVGARNDAEGQPTHLKVERESKANAVPDAGGLEASRGAKLVSQ